MKLKERLDIIFDVKSYGYKVNKWFLRSAFILMVLLFLVVVRVDGWDVAVHGGQALVCPESEVRCLNPFVAPVCKSEPTVDGMLFNNLVDCEPVYLMGGETYGVVPSRLARLFPYLCVGLFAFAILLNHLIYNRNFKVKNNELDK